MEAEGIERDLLFGVGVDGSGSVVVFHRVAEDFFFHGGKELFLGELKLVRGPLLEVTKKAP